MIKKWSKEELEAMLEYYLLHITGYILEGDSDDVTKASIANRTRKNHEDVVLRFLTFLSDR